MESETNYLFLDTLCNNFSYTLSLRLLLDKMNNSTEAVRIVKESESVEAAKTVAQYFTKIGDFASAIRFLLLSKCYNAAYELALKHRKMEIYANWIGK